MGAAESTSSTDVVGAHAPINTAANNANIIHLVFLFFNVRMLLPIFFLTYCRGYPTTLLCKSGFRPI